MGKQEKQEACQLYIEQEIESGLAENLTPYEIGKRVAAWIEKLFEVKISPKSIEMRTRRKLVTNVTKETTANPANEIQENQIIKRGIFCQAESK